MFFTRYEGEGDPGRRLRLRSGATGRLSWGWITLRRPYLYSALRGEGSVLARRRFRQWRKAMLMDRVAQVTDQAKTGLPTQAQTRKSARKQMACFERNRSKMLYQTFRAAGYFIGSGVVEAGCKMVVGQRLKQSGMLLEP
jgi:hypothetical protein